MCGVVAIYKNFNDQISEEEIKTATKKLSHRGPDGQNVWISKNKNIALGHSRLAIMDTKKGTQPMVSPDGKFAMVVNGEIYNYKQIRSEMEMEGYKFSTNSDSEVVIPLYKKYDINFPKYIRGEFSIIIYDQTKNKIVAARDRFGIKPLVYSKHLDGLYLASEAKAIFGNSVKPSWDIEALYHSLCFQYLPRDKTFFKEISQLQPGHTLSFDGKIMKIQKYWDIDFPNLNSKNILENNENEIVSNLNTLIKESVSLRLQSDIAKYCCHLSGGVDSSLIAAIASLSGGAQNNHCFNVSFSKESYDESNQAKLVANYLGAQITTIKIDSKDIIDNLKESIYFGESTVINGHIAAKYLLNKEIKKKGYKIALTGEGADELFGGYTHLMADILGDNNISSQTVSGIHTPIDNLRLDLSPINTILGYEPTFLKAKSSIGYKINSLLDQRFIDNNKLRVEDIINNFIDKNTARDQLLGRSRGQQSAYIWSKFSLANYILKTLGDGMEMANGIEGRVPFLDHKISEYSIKIDPALHTKNKTPKYLLRQVAKKYLPETIWNAPKKPFMSPPLSTMEWNKYSKQFFTDIFLSKNFSDMGIFDNQKLINIVDNLQNKTEAEQIALEPLLMIPASVYLLAENFNL